MFTYARHSIRSARRDVRGQALAMAAVSIVAVIAVGALAVDLGMAFAARAAAQRAADSSALAGASAFIDYTYTLPSSAEHAEARAYEYALNNDVLARPIDSSQVTVWVVPDSQKVRVMITASDLPTWFARVLGVFSMDVAARAAAVASDGGTSDQCVLPFAIGDLWHDVNDDTNENRIPDGGELWNFDVGEDVYDVFNSESNCQGYNWSTCNDGTGLGSNWRDGFGDDASIRGDVGRKIWIKAGPPNPKRDPDAGGTDIMVGPGNFYIWEMPDPDMDCQGRPGATWVHDNILGCNACDVSIGVEYETQTGNIASIKDDMKALMDLDPNAKWDPINKRIVDSAYDGESSPRVRVVPLWDPHQELQGKTTFKFNNFAKIFIEGGGTEPPDFPIYARFLGVITGGSAGPNTGSLVKYLRLVE